MRFIEVEIIFHASEVMRSKPKEDSLCLFKIYLSSILEIEMCNVTVHKKAEIKQSLIAFQLLKPNTVLNWSKSKAITIVKLISSKFSMFDRIIRSSELSIIEIDNCLIEQCQSKMISLVNPYILKVINSNFENNNDYGLHIKFRENLKSLKSISANLATVYGKSKVYLHNNEFARSQGSSILIEGCVNSSRQVSLDLLISNCTFKESRQSCISISDCVYSKLIIESSTFSDNYENGLMLKRNVSHKAAQLGRPFNEVAFKIKDLQAGTESFENEDDNYEMNTVIRKNTFVENEGSGIVISYMNAVILDNEFIKNNCFGIVLYSAEGTEKCLSQSRSELIQPTQQIPIPKTHILKCKFSKNGLSGLKILNFAFSVSIKLSVFQENFEYGVHVENEEAAIGNANSLKSDYSKKLESTHESDIYYKGLENPFIHLIECQILYNLKSGIYMNNRHIQVNQCLIQENLKYSFELQNIAHKSMIQIDQLTLNKIEGRIGGPWGEQHISTFTADCISCLSKKSFKSSNFISKCKKDNEKSSKKENGCQVY